MGKDEIKLMRTVKKLNPGMKGTKKLVEIYGENLVCVRYKEDKENKVRFKTIELIIEKKPIDPVQSSIPANKKMALKVNYGEVHIGRAIKSVGGIWNAKEKVWELPWCEVQALGLENRIVKMKAKPTVSNNGNPHNRASPKSAH